MTSDPLFKKPDWWLLSVKERSKGRRHYRPLLVVTNHQGEGSGRTPHLAVARSSRQEASTTLQQLRQQMIPMLDAALRLPGDPATTARLRHWRKDLQKATPRKVYAGDLVALTPLMEQGVDILDVDGEIIALTHEGWGVLRGLNQSKGLPVQDLPPSPTILVGKAVGMMDDAGLLRLAAKLSPDDYWAGKILAETPASTLRGTQPDGEA